MGREVPAPWKKLFCMNLKKASEKLQINNNPVFYFIVSKLNKHSLVTFIRNEIILPAPERFFESATVF